MGTYYVDATGGSDAWPGTEAQPWQTLTYAMAGARGLSPGDSLLLKRGEIWREQVATGWSGSSGSPITIADYGSGNKPSIRGSEHYSSWTNSGTNLWYTTGINTEPYVFCYDGSTGIRKTAKVSLGSQWDYWWDDPNNYLWVYSVGNPTTHATLLEIARRNSAIGTQSADYITFENLDFRQTIVHNILLWGATNIIINSCDFKSCGGSGVQFHNGSNDGEVNDCTFDDWNIEAELSYAIQVTGKNYDDTGPVDVDGCTFNASIPGTGSDHGVVMSEDGGWLRSISNCTVNGNNGNVKHNGFTFWKPIAAATSFTCEDNVFTDVGGYSIGMGAVPWNSPSSMTIRVRRNLITNSCLSDGNQSAIRVRDIEATYDCEISYNVINGTYDGSSLHHGIALNQDLSGVGAQNVKIYNNTITGCDSGIQLNNDSEDADIQNNIVCNNRRYGLQVKDGCTATTDYNCFYDNTLGNYQEEGTGSITIGDNDITDDPSLDANLELQEGSPCIETGANLGFDQDIAGTSVPQGSVPCMGAYEYVSEEEEEETNAAPELLFFDKRYDSLYEGNDAENWTSITGAYRRQPYCAYDDVRRRECVYIPIIPSFHHYVDVVYHMVMGASFSQKEWFSIWINLQTAKDFASAGFFGAAKGIGLKPPSKGNALLRNVWRRGWNYKIYNVEDIKDELHYLIFRFYWIPGYQGRLIKVDEIRLWERLEDAEDNFRNPPLEIMSY